MKKQKPVLKAMKILHFLLFASLMGLALLFRPLSADADSHAKDRALIQKAYQKMDATTNRKDTEGYLVYLHPAYTVIDDQGKVTTRGKEMLRGKLIKAFPMTSRFKLKTAIYNITFAKDGATVDVLTTYDIVSADYHLEMTDVRRSLEYWTKTPQGWLLYQSRTISSHYKEKRLP